MSFCAQKRSKSWLHAVQPVWPGEAVQHLCVTKDRVALPKHSQHVGWDEGRECRASIGAPNWPKGLHQETRTNFSCSVRSSSSSLLLFAFKDSNPCARGEDQARDSQTEWAVLGSGAPHMSKGVKLGVASLM